MLRFVLSAIAATAIVTTAAAGLGKAIAPPSPRLKTIAHVTVYAQDPPSRLIAVDHGL